MARGFRSTRRGGSATILGAVAVTAAISISVTLLATGQRISSVGQIGDAIGRTIGPILSAPVHGVQSGLSYVGSYFGGAGRIRALEAENQALNDWRNQARAMAERLDAYEQLHHVRGEVMSQGVAGRMVAETNGPFSRTGVLNVGTKQGVAVNWIVINQNGLVGRVVSVGADSARVLYLTDAASRVPVMGELSRARALLIGDKTDAPKVAHLNLPQVIRPNERLMTSGDDGIFPRGLAVGTLGQGPDGNSRARLAVARAPIDFVRVIPPSNFPPPAEAVSAIAVPAVVDDTGNEVGAAGNATMPLAAGAADVPATNSVAAIAAAQAQTTSRGDGPTTSANAANARPTARPKAVTRPNDNFRVVVRDGNAGASAPPAAPASGAAAPATGDAPEQPQ